MKNQKLDSQATHIENISPPRQRLCIIKPVQSQGIENIRLRRTLVRKLNIKKG